MDKKQKILAKMEQNKVDTEKIIAEGNKLVEELAELDKPKVTYSCGDKLERGGEEAILSQVRADEVCLVRLDSGNRLLDPISVIDSYEITQEHPTL